MKRLTNSIIQILFGFVVLALANSASVAQTKATIRSTGTERPESIIYIGNSFFYFNNGISGMVARILASADPKYKLRSTLVTISGSGFDWHDVGSYFRPDAVGRYTIDDNNVVTFNQPNRLFDLAIMMDCSQCPVHPRLQGIFYEYAKIHAETARKNGSEPVFFMSWAYLDKPEMTEQLAEAYTRIGNENKALVIPAGLAFARSVKERPDIRLYIADKRHPTMAGTYLAALTIYAAIFKKSPVGISYTADLGEESARFLQKVAWDTVSDYLAP
ncbi:hypothetical protein [Bosea vaviloviae]|uniref:SGNH/GDSL hydrolase family protein n=1 Tax=Bosea vaviloviae TaxID=1526658 RepID=A0A1D7UAP5_9HYPH|nr:hypothetical protein [Bosea vaviloviae]AOO84452.1 hypothetical protein BHK69_13785 [Bosea vaviloviae]